MARMLASECVPPLAPAPWAWEPYRQIDGVRQILESCSARQDLVRVNCTEFPCLASFDYAEVERDCDAILTTLGLGERPSVWSGTDRVLVPLVLPRTSVGSRQVALDRRIAARETELAAWLGSASAPDVVQPDCDWLKDKVAGIAEDDVCSQMMAVWGCSEQEADRERHEQIVRHIRAAEEEVEQLEARCPEFKKWPHMLDCQQLPCVLVLDAADMPAYNGTDPANSWVGDAMCSADRVWDVDGIYAMGHPQAFCNIVAFFPLWSDDLPEGTEEAYYRDRSSMQNRLCFDFENTYR